MNERYIMKFLQDMALRNFTPSTVTTYHGSLVHFLSFISKEATSITYADIRRYIFHLRDVENKKPSTINCHTATIQFFFEYTLGYTWNPKKVPKMKRDRQLPVVLSREQVLYLIDATKNYKHKAMIATMYSAGLRVSEACHLRYEDILRSKQMIYVSKSKSRQDRYTILSARNLEILTEYWYHYNRPKGWLFPGGVYDQPITKDTVRRFTKKIVRELGFSENVTPHTLRHSFAVHLLEDGVSQTYIQHLLGHQDPHSTNVYLQMTSKALLGISSPLDMQEGEKHE